MATVSVEKRRRGPVGVIVAVLFWSWQLLMAAWLVTGLTMVGEHSDGAASEAARAGTAIGATIGVGLIMMAWLVGSLILGLMLLFTRGRKVTITRETA